VRHLTKNGWFGPPWAGSGISGVVLPVLVYQRTGSPALTSLLAAVEVLPYIAFGLLAGAFADRVRRRRLMVGCDLGCAALMATIPVAGAFGRLTIPLVVLVALGAASLFVWFDAASFGAVPALAGPGRVVQAVSGLSAAGSVTGLVAPAVAGGLLALIAPAQPVIVDAASYLISAVLLASIRRPFETRPASVPGDGDRPDTRAEPDTRDQPDGRPGAGRRGNPGRAAFPVGSPAAAGVCYSMVTVNGIAYRQEVTPDGLQSRVNTAGRMLAWGGYPLGALAGGALAEVLPIRVTLLVMTLPVAISFVLGFRPLSRDRQRGDR
jgi:MFS family permease